MLSLAIFLTLSLIFMAVSVVLQNKSDAVARTEVISREERLIEVEKTIVTGKIDRLTRDLLYIKDTWYIGGPEHDYANIKQMWLSFANRSKNYERLRFIDKDGNEVVCVRYSSRGSFVDNSSRLRNRRGCSYFEDAVSLAENYIYVSRLDLDAEQEDYQPRRPVIRLAVQIRESSGKLAGVVLLDYLADDMLKQVRRAANTSPYDLYLLNSDGYWVYNKNDASSEWSFLYRDKTNVSFANVFQQEWAAVRQQRSGHLTTGNGLFCFTDIFTRAVFSPGGDSYHVVLGAGDFYLVSRISPDSPVGSLFVRSQLEILLYSIKRNIFVYVLLLLISSFCAVFMLAKRGEKEEIKYYSEYDALTGIYNRRMAFAKFRELYDSGKDSKRCMCVCFIDVNGLKDVNDTLGHDDGDELLKTIVKVIRESVRANDVIARLGGDEFLIVFDGIGAERAEEVWLNRVVNSFARINETEGRRYLVSASHGIEAVDYSSGEPLDAVVNRADEKMYAEKREIKKGLKIIRC